MTTALPHRLTSRERPRTMSSADNTSDVVFVRLAITKDEFTKKSARTSSQSVSFRNGAHRVGACCASRRPLHPVGDSLWNFVPAQERPDWREKDWHEPQTPATIALISHGPKLTTVRVSAPRVLLTKAPVGVRAVRASDTNKFCSHQARKMIEYHTAR
jgi:hypothetical protein